MSAILGAGADRTARSTQTDSLRHDSLLSFLRGDKRDRGDSQ